MKADSLAAAIDLLDPEDPLSTDEQLRDYYVERELSPIADIELQLRHTKRPSKILFTGHRGVGKSTELARLRQGLKGEFVFAHIHVKSALNLFDLNYVDVLLALALELIALIEKERVGIDDAVVDHVAKFAQDITEETETGQAFKAEVGAEVSGGVTALLTSFGAKLSSKFAAEDVTRETVRQKVSHRITDLLESIDFLAKGIEKSTGKRVLAIVEDLDKADLETAKTIFCNHAMSLAAPSISAIYTFPTALRHDNEFTNIKSTFPDPQVVPNIKTADRKGSPYEPGRTVLRSLLLRRVEERLITDGALDRLISLSSGIPRELLALARRAALEGLKVESDVIDIAQVELAKDAELRTYQTILSKDQIKALRQVRESKKINNDDDHRQLLQNLSVLEFRNTTLWYDVHPIVRSLIDG